MNLLERFVLQVKQESLFSSKDKLILAVSGGVDSVVLCELCKQAGYAFTIAHCNFQLRGAESERDEAFVKKLGKEYAVQTFIKKFDTENFASGKKLSIQEAARELRYTWFAELVSSQLPAVNNQPAAKPICHSPVAIYLLTAHHADDNIETISMHFFRGTGLHGLTGIPARIGFTRRPLLEFSKEELTRFAKEHQLGFVEDSSNQSSKYTRNFFRNEIIPAVSRVYPQVKENLQDNIKRFREIESLYRLAADGIIQKITKQKGNEIHIPVKKLMGFRNRALIYEIIAKYGFHEKQVDELVKLAGSESGKYIQSPNGSFRIIRHRHWFIVSPVHSGEATNIIIEQTDKHVSFLLGEIKIEVADNKPPLTGNEFACLDAKQISFPLLLRKWKNGDYFYPLGMKKKKKLSRFFIDLKLSKAEKEKVWVVESGQRIAWIVGYRIDDRFRMTEKTKTTIRLSFKK